MKKAHPAYLDGLFFSLPGMGDNYRVQVPNAP